MGCKGMPVCVRMNKWIALSEHGVGEKKQYKTLKDKSGVDNEAWDPTLKQRKNKSGICGDQDQDRKYGRRFFPMNSWLHQSRPWGKMEAAWLESDIS